MLNAKTKFGFKKGHVRRAAYPNFGVYDFFVRRRYTDTQHRHTCIAYIYSTYVYMRGGGERGSVYCVYIITFHYYYM